MIRKIVLVTLMSVSLAACETTGTKEKGGILLGAVGGALLGSTLGSGTGKTVAIAAGTLLGALLGSEIGRSLDNADRQAMQQTTYEALESQPSGNTSTWRNPDSGNSGTITPVRTYQQASSAYCREYEQTIIVGGREETATGTACRQADGNWKIVE